MIINPFLRYTWIRNNGQAVGICLESPVRGQSLNVASIMRDDEREIFEFIVSRLLLQSSKGSEIPIPEHLVSRLSEIRMLVSEDQVPRRVEFSCNLEDFSEECLTFSDKADGPLIVNPTFRFAKLNEKLQSVISKSTRFAKGAVWITLSDAGFHSSAIYSIDPVHMPWLEKLKPGESPPADIPEFLRTKLVFARILTSLSQLNQDRESKSCGLARFGETFASTSYAVLHSMYHPNQLTAMKEYARNLIAEGYLQFGDDGWPLRYFEYGEPVTRLFHHLLVDPISAIVGKTLKPTFSYLTSYRPGSHLARHRDREQCEYAVSFLIDEEPDPQGRTSWPIYIERPNTGEDPIEIRLAIGEMLLYRGCEIFHFRDPLPAGKACTVMLFFFVSDGFTGSLE